MDEERPQNDEMISTSLGHMTYKEYRELSAPEIPIDEDYKCERTNDLFEFRSDKTTEEGRTNSDKKTIKKLFLGFKSNLFKKDKNRDMDR